MLSPCVEPPIRVGKALVAHLCTSNAQAFNFYVGNFKKKYIYIKRLSEKKKKRRRKRHRETAFMRGPAGEEKKGTEKQQKNSNPPGAQPGRGAHIGLYFLRERPAFF